MAGKNAIVVLLLALAGAFASAQTVYRCGNSYGTQPCTGGTPLDVTDHAAPADAARATRLAAEDWKRAEAMEKARLAQEKAAPKAMVMGPKDLPPKPPAKEHAKAHKDKKKEKPADPAEFTVKGPKEPKK